MGDVLYPVNICCSDGLINKAVWPTLRQNKVRWDLPARERGRGKTLLAAARRSKM